MGKQGLHSKIEAFVRALRELAPAFELTLDERLIQTLAGHYAWLLKWNQKIHLTSVLDPAQAARCHYLESLYATRYLVPQAHMLIDIGSGAGFPGFPIAAFRSDVEVVLIESQVRKATFLRLASQQLGLKNLTVFPGRFQDYEPRDFDVVLCRAIDRFGDMLPDILRFGRVARQILLFVGKALAGKCLAAAGGAWQVDQFVIPLSKQRLLVSLSLMRST